MKHDDQARRHAGDPQNQRSSQGLYLLTGTNSRFPDRFLMSGSIRVAMRS
jgi:hypothetical protein